MGGPSWFWVDTVPPALSSEGQPCLRSRTVLSLPSAPWGPQVLKPREEAGPMHLCEQRPIFILCFAET